MPKCSMCGKGLELHDMDGVGLVVLTKEEHAGLHRDKYHGDIYHGKVVVGNKPSSIKRKLHLTEKELALWQTWCKEAESEVAYLRGKLDNIRQESDVREPI